MSKISLANFLFLKGKHKEAFDTYMEIVTESPDCIAAANIGYMYHRGIAVTRNYKKAMSFYTAASEGDKGASFFNMALMYMRGQGVEVNLVKALELMKRSAEQGCADARLYLGLAYLLGYLYDPVEIECLSLIPFYRVIYRDQSTPLLMGEGFDPSLEDKRYEVIDADGNEAVKMYRRLTVEHRNDPHTANQCGAATLMCGKAYIEGLGDCYDPAKGFKMIYRSALYNNSAEAAQYLIENKERAVAFGVDVDKIELLSADGYFRPIMGNLGTPKSHRVPLLLPDDDSK